MRLTVELNFRNKPPFLIPGFFRRNIVSLIKKAVRFTDPDGETFKKYWDNSNPHVVKPFTFHLSLPLVHYIDLDEGRFIKLLNKSIKLHISSSDFKLLSILHDWFLNQAISIYLFNYNTDVVGIDLVNDKIIDSGLAKFKILSPVIARDIAIENKRRKSQGYLSCNSPEFKDSLAYSIYTLSTCFLGNKKINVKDIEIDASRCQSSKIFHYMETIPVTLGTIGIKADNEVLGLIYNVGLGARRSQGFGMLDLIEESGHDSVRIQEKSANTGYIPVRENQLSVAGLSQQKYNKFL